MPKPPPLPPTPPLPTRAALGATTFFLPTRSVLLLCASRATATDAWTTATRCMKRDWPGWGGVEVLLDVSPVSGGVSIKIDVAARARAVTAGGGVYLMISDLDKAAQSNLGAALPAPAAVVAACDGNETQAAAATIVARAAAIHAALTPPALSLSPGGQEATTGPLFVPVLPDGVDPGQVMLAAAADPELPPLAAATLRAATRDPIPAHLVLDAAGLPPLPCGALGRAPPRVDSATPAELLAVCQSLEGRGVLSNDGASTTIRVVLTGTANPRAGGGPGLAAASGLLGLKRALRTAAATADASRTLTALLTLARASRPPSAGALIASGLAHEVAAVATSRAAPRAARRAAAALGAHYRGTLTNGVVAAARKRVKRAHKKMVLG